MPLATHVQNRYSTQVLANLTNPNDSSATTVDTTVLGYAVDDVTGDFETVIGLAYDDNDARHVSVAVEGVVAKLATRTLHGGDDARERHERWLTRLRQLRARIVPDTSSLMTVTDELRGGSTIRPRFDDAAFDDYMPESPPGA